MSRPTEFTHTGSVAQIGFWSDALFPRTDPSHDVSDVDSKRGEAVQHRRTDLEPGDLTFEVSRGQMLARQFRCAELRLTQRILVSTRFSRWCPRHRRQMVRRKQRGARRASVRAMVPGSLVFLRDGMVSRCREPYHPQKGMWVCACHPASTLESQDESLMTFVQQSPANVVLAHALDLIAPLFFIG